ncbi:MAG: prepilin peptidase [Bryobacteraceae bacterium]
MLEPVVAALAGLLVGSFLNVCIYRWPRDLSVVRPRSFCPGCEKPIAAADNIPLVSYLLLGGKCRHCQARIPIRYPIVELLTAALFAFCVFKFGVTPAALKFSIFSAILVGLTFSDLEERILPDELTLGGAAIGVAFAWFVPVPRYVFSFVLALAGVRWPDSAFSLVESASGAIVPPLLLWLCGFLFEKIRKKEGLGFGDVKMISAIGGFLGMQGALLTLILASIAGSVLGLAFILIARKDASSYELPFGTFLGAAALGVALW